MARTLLKYVQLILNSMDSDEVEAYDETIESLQVADILEHTYYEILHRRDWEFLKHRPRTLDAGTHKLNLLIPEDVMHVELLRYKDYDTGKFKELEYLSPAEFMLQQQDIDTSQSNVITVDAGDGIALPVYNDRAPSYWTSFDEEYITFDAYDAVDEIDGVMPGSTLMLATILPTWTASDSFVPDLPQRMESLLLNEAISACWLYVRQEANPKAEAIARRQFARMTTLERKTKIDQEDEVNYGRKPRGYSGLYIRR